MSNPIVCLAALAVCVSAAAAQTGAAGGGKVYTVTTLEDYIPGEDQPIAGSFRAALEAKGPRTIEFRVAGNIDLKTDLWIKNGGLVIAGETAPAPGICVRQYPVVLRGRDMTVRNLRFRLGDLSGVEGDSFRLADSQNILIDHCSFSWATDSNLRIGRDSARVTVQWCIISEALTGRGCGFGATISGRNIRLHHNLLALNQARNPKLLEGFIDFRNNGIYGWRDDTGYSIDPKAIGVNFIANYLKPGPAARGRSLPLFHAARRTIAYVGGNFVEGAPDQNDRARTRIAEGARLQDAEMSMKASGIRYEEEGEITLQNPPASNPAKAYEEVLASAGATLPRRDAVDARVVAAVRSGGGKLIRSQADVGGWPGAKAAPAARRDSSSAEKVLAFPGAEGYGAYTRGGRGGKVFLVTNLKDYIPGKEPPAPGSFRVAIEAEGARIVVFRVSGYIDLKAPVKLINSNITIAGQSAPGDGVCLRDSEMDVKADQVILRFLRWRPGDRSRQQLDGITTSYSRDIIYDHCSVSWANDELMSVTRDAENVTIQWCLLGEALHRSYHKSSENHGYGSLIDTPHGSFHHNLYAHNTTRIPRPGDARLDFRNNVVYNWNNQAGYTGPDNVLRMNYIGNYLKPGPSTQHGRDMAFWAASETRVFAEGNFLEGSQGKTDNNRLMIDLPDGARFESAAFPVAPVITHSAREAFEAVLKYAGAVRPVRDAVDARIVSSVRDGAGRHIDSQEQVGGWPELRPGRPPVDSDSDGIPDDWEIAHGLNPKDPSDAARKSRTGRTNIEDYLNSPELTGLR